MENLRCQLEATGRKRRKRLAPGEGGGEQNTMEPIQSLRSDQPQETVLNDQASNDFADHSTEVRSAFVVLKNMNLLQHNMHSLSRGQDQTRWTLTPSDHENMVTAATSSMCTIVGVLTRSVVTAVNNLAEVQTTVAKDEFDTNLESC
ncbi:hypothetical protein BG003_003055 [Podila horticola]|nr:hypothetical protein BG003_003055 [Podila horticola]